MKINFLGTGTAIPIKLHSPAGLLIQVDDQFLQFDIGPGTLSRLNLVDINYRQITQLFISHMHPDHTLDLATLMLIFNFAPGAERKLPFTITACLGFKDFLGRMIQLYPEISPLTYELIINEVGREEMLLGKVKITTALTGHTPESIAFRIDDGQHVIVYSGDANPRGELAELALGADILVSECSFPSGWETDDHFNADTLGLTASKAGVKSLYITHRYPPALEVDIIAQLRTHFNGEIFAADDGLVVSLR